MMNTPTASLPDFALRATPGTAGKCGGGGHRTLFKKAN